MTLPELIAQLKADGLIARARRIKCADIEIELAAPVDTEPKTVTLDIPETQLHGQRISEEEALRRAEDEMIQGMHAASRGFIPSYGPE